MDRFHFRKLWTALIHWKGWKAFGSACVRLWKATAAWIGWKKLFFLPFGIALTLFLLCCAALIWIFAKHMEQHTFSVCLYAMAAYLLTSVCVRLPSGLKNIHCWMDRHPKLVGLLHNQQFKFTVGLYAEQFLNFAYGIFKIVTGVIVGSAWIGCDGIYNLVQALIQLFQILRRRNPGTIEKQWQSYRLCGVLILLMHLTLIGIVFQMVNWNRAEESGEIMIICTATFAFYKFISSFIDLAKDRKHAHPIDSSVRMLELSQAIFAIFSLQAGLLHTFGTGESWESLLNLAMGCTVCMMTAAMGIYMIRRANREIKKLQEHKHGTK